MDSMDQNERTIKAKNLFLYPVYYWRSVLAAFLCIVLLGGIFVGVQVYREERADKLNVDTSADAAFKKYQEKKDQLNADLERLEKKESIQKDYMDHSIRFQIDPYKTWHAKYSVYIDTEYKIMPEMTYQDPDKTPVITGVLCDLLEGSDVKKKIASSQELDAPQVTELYNVYSEKDNQLVIEVLGDTESRVTEILDLLKVELDKNATLLHDKFGSFSLQKILESCGEEVNSELAEEQEILFSDNQKIQNEIRELRNELENLSAPVVESPETVGKLVIIVALALVLSYGFYCVKFLCSGCFYEKEELQYYWKMNTLGIVPTEKKYGKLEKWARKLEDRVMLQNSEACALAAANILNYCGDKKSLLVVGDAPEAVCRTVTEELQKNLPDVKLQYSGNLLTCAASAAALGKCDGAILIEQCGSSKISHITQEVSYISDIQKPLLGCVVVDL